MHPIDILRNKIIRWCKKTNNKRKSIYFGKYIFSITDKGSFFYQEIVNGFAMKEMPVKNNRDVGKYFFENINDINVKFEQVL